mgnify:FL=1
MYLRMVTWAYSNLKGATPPYTSRTMTVRLALWILYHGNISISSNKKYDILNSVSAEKRVV